MAKPLKASEFEDKGPKRFGFFGIAAAREKLRLLYRTEQDPIDGADLDATPDKWRHGGIDSIRDVTSGTIPLPGGKKK